MDSNAAYCEALGQQRFDWNAYLSEAALINRSHPEYERACKLAASWVTCAIGNQCAIIPRGSSWEPHCPKDKKLRVLGNRFFHLVRKNDLVGARETLEAIEERSAELIAEIREEVYHG